MPRFEQYNIKIYDCLVVVFNISCFGYNILGKYQGVLIRHYRSVVGLYSSSPEQGLVTPLCRSRPQSIYPVLPDKHRVLLTRI